MAWLRALIVNLIVYRMLEQIKSELYVIFYRKYMYMYIYSMFCLLIFTMTKMTRIVMGYAYAYHLS